MKRWGFTAKRRRPAPSRKQRRIFLPLILGLCFAFFLFLLLEIDRTAFPQVLAMTELQTKGKINTTINQSVSDVTKELSVTAEDFYRKTADQTGRVQDISVNTLLVNDYCSRLAQKLSNDLVTMGNETVSLPLGSLSRVRLLANVGPRYKVTVMPMGDAYVNYDSAFTTAGINQINFQLWLNVDSTVKIVNPLQSADIKISRKILLVNTIISGEVPDAYLNASPFQTEKNN